MEKFYKIIFALFIILATSCQKSQFSTTTRHSNNGRVTYSNHHRVERSKIAKVKTPKSNPTPRDEQTPTSESRNLIASATNDPGIITMITNQFIFKNELNFPIRQSHGMKSDHLFPDSIKSEKQIPGTSKGNAVSKVNIIKFKDGQSKAVRILSRSQDTLMYQSITEPGVVRGVTMENVDSILSDTRKTDPLGLIGFISSILGLFPVFGIPFAILALILGAKSIRKIRRKPDQFKGKGFAKASMVLGIIGLIISVVFFIFSLATAVHSCSHVHIRF